jgi:hypothetical protein
VVSDAVRSYLGAHAGEAQSILFNCHMFAALGEEPPATA